MNTQFCELLILGYGLAFDRGEQGRPTTMGTLLKYLEDAGVRVSAVELIRNFHGMRGELLLELRKWDDSRGFVDFSEFGDEDRFFWGEFRICPSYAGKKHYERLSAAFATQVPLNNRPIGFTAG
jgi:hypothetical protein